MNKYIKKLSYALVHITFFLSTHIYAQHSIFLSEGRIEFERKINLYAQIDDDEDSDWKDLMKKTMPQFKLNYFNLKFIGNRTLYKPGRENVENNKLWRQPAEDNVVFTDLKKTQCISQKNVFEQTFLVQDSTRNIQWKITDETRNIAGFDCRRANAIIIDSIYLVAFYTDAITTSGGPESFTGLPGMILGVAIPHEHITWFATKVYAEKIPDTELTAPAKGKKVNNASLKITIQDAIKGWGKWGRRYLQATML